VIAKLAVLVRYLFGFNFLINGITWWWKIMPYPTRHDPPNIHTPQFVQAMIDTGFLFDGIKVVEVVAGVALLANLYVPLALVVAFPVTVAAWAVDVGLLGSSVRAQVLGWSVLLMNTFLMLAYIDSYSPLLRVRALPSSAWAVGRPR
jgi:putative oxidoreductase